VLKEVGFEVGFAQSGLFASFYEIED